MEYPKIYTDREIVQLLKEDSSHLDLLWRKHKEYCMNFMRRYNNNEDYNRDIFHDALIVFYEVVQRDSFELTCSIQTFLNSVCRNQLMVRLKKSLKHEEITDEFDDSILDYLTPVENKGEQKLVALETALKKMKVLGGQCYEILQRFYYRNQSMEKIAFEMNYKNADSVKNQSARCRKKLREIAYEITSKHDGETGN
jgi:RNA polymerase sigma factor (sigma-70 family)